MERSSVFGGTLALAEICRLQGEATFGSHDAKNCEYCSMDIKDKHAGWITDQCIKQGLSHERQV